MNDDWPPINDHTSIEDQTKQVQLDIARIDLQLKKLELRNRPGFWKGVFTNPAFLAAAISVCITGTTAFVSWNSARIQREADEAKIRLETNKAVMLALFEREEGNLACKAKVFLELGLLKDDDKQTVRKLLETMEKKSGAKCIDWAVAR